MANYTVTLQNLLASNVNIGLTDYPIFDPAYRETLNQKIKDHYWLREIGAETPALFVWWLNVKMREIMPLYNQYYESALLAFDPLSTYKMSETSRKESAGTSVGSGASTSEMANANTTHNRNVHSDTPSGLLAMTNIEKFSYASDADINDGDATNTGDSISTATNTNTVNAIDEIVKTVEGRNGGQSPASMIKEFRANFINIDMMIVNELQDLFMLIW